MIFCPIMFQSQTQTPIDEHYCDYVIEENFYMTDVSSSLPLTATLFTQGFNI